MGSRYKLEPRATEQQKNTLFMQIKLFEDGNRRVNTFWHKKDVYNYHIYPIFPRPSLVGGLFVKTTWDIALKACCQGYN